MTSIAGIPVRNTSNLINEDTKFCGLVFCPTGFGKTTFGASMDRMTRKYFGKPSLIIAIEAGEGGGTMSIQQAGVDYVCPTSFDELGRILSGLAGDQHYGGVVFDSATEYVNRFLKPYALKFPYAKGSPSPTRAMGVPEQGDYQTMGEQARIDFNKLIALTVHPDLKVRKHVLVTALEKEKTNRDTGALIAIQPDLPGAMASASAAMFQTVGSIGIKSIVGKDSAGRPTRTQSRLFITEGDGVRLVKDRTNLLPGACEPDLELIWEKYWLPKIIKPTSTTT